MATTTPTPKSSTSRATALLAGVAALVVAGGAFTAGVVSAPTDTKIVAAAAPFPTPASTGVPAGTALTDMASTTIRACGKYDARNVTGDLTILASNGTHSSSTPCVTFTRSKVNGIVDDKWSSYPCAGFSGCGPVVFIDSEVSNPTARDVAAVSDANVYLWRSYVHGARSGVQCDGNCEIHDSYLLADREFNAAHMDAFISNGNYSAPMLLDHTTLLCKPTTTAPNGAGCAADLGLFGDFSAITNTTITNNLFLPPDGYYCTHTGYEPGKPYPSGGHITFTGNVFQRGPSGKCGQSGPVFNWNNSAGTWCNNLFDDGTAALPGNADNCGSTPPTTVTTTTVPVPPTSNSTPSSVPAPTTTTSTTSTSVPGATTTTTFHLGFNCRPVKPTPACVQSP